jgi:drug/metabolite transporter (DMT)-like permease
MVICINQKSSILITFTTIKIHSTKIIITLIYLIGSILLTSYLTLSFKAVERFNIPVFQAIVFNYLTCVVTGSIVNGSFPINGEALQQPWFKWALVMGMLFISLFNVIGYTAQKIGVAVASVANKLSLVIPFAFSIYLYNEQATWLKITGIVIALIAVVFTCWPNTKAQGHERKQLGMLPILLPAILFVGSGMLDTLVKYVQQTYLDESNNNAYLISCFAVAGIVGSIILIAVVASGKQQFNPRSIIAGIIIGIPNYFSIWCLVNVLKVYEGNSSAIIPINNMGIVLFSSIMAALIFRERLSTINWIGIFLALGAIALIAFG